MNPQHPTERPASQRLKLSKALMVPVLCILIVSSLRSLIRNAGLWSWALYEWCFSRVIVIRLVKTLQIGKLPRPLSNKEQLELDTSKYITCQDSYHSLGAQNKFKLLVALCPVPLLETKLELYLLA